MNDKKVPVLKVQNITKHFGEVCALEDVSFDLYEDDILGLVGSNGAGKSTLIKIISGLFPPTSGLIYLEGKEVHFNSPHEAREMGISTVHQKMEEILAPNHDVVSNVFMGEELHRPLFGRWLPWPRVLNEGEMEQETARVLSKIRINVDSIRRPIVSYSGGQRQSVAIAKAIRKRPKILILDEPTAALGVKETRQVLGLIKDLGRHGIPIILITHDLEEVFEVANRIVVLRNGRKVGECYVNEVDKEDVVGMIVGGEEIGSSQ